MSSPRNERVAKRRLKDQRRKLDEILALDRGVSASADVPGKPGVHQIAFLRRSREGMISVKVEQFYSTSWDDTLSEESHFFTTLDEALTWIEASCGIPWTELHEPQAPKTP